MCALWLLKVLAEFFVCSGKWCHLQLPWNFCQSIWNWQGYDIRYQFAGSDGPALLLIHGFGANSDHWRKNLPFLAKSHRVYAIDPLGYGYSDKPNLLEFPVNSLYTFETWAKQINEFCLDVVKDRAFFICNSHQDSEGHGFLQGTGLVGFGRGPLSLNSQLGNR
jgi:hypothetical protein